MSRKRARRLTWPFSGAVSVLWSTEDRNRYIRVDLSDPAEADRPIELNLSLEEATYLGNRLLQRVEAAEASNARDAR